MNKVLLIDDEILSIEYLKGLSLWEKFNCKVIGYALTVGKAIELFRSERPEIVFIDIRMPKMDGLELSRKLLDIFPDTSIVIMTAYQEFDYVKEAIQIGVTYFLVKHEINEEKLSEVLRKIESEIDSKKYFKNIIWNNWLHFIWESGEVRDIDIAGLPQMNSTYFFTLVNLSPFSLITGESEEIYLKEEELRKINVPEIKIRAYSRLGKCIYGIVAEYKKPASWSIIHEKILEFTGLLEHMCRSNVSGTVTFYISDFFCGQSEFVSICRRAKLFSECILWNRHRVLTEAEFKDYHELACENIAGVSEGVHGEKNLICYLMEKGKNEKWYVTAESFDFLSKIAVRLNVEEYQRDKNNKKAVICVEQYLQWCLRYLESVEEEKEGDKSGDSKAERAAQYIKIHFHEDLSSSLLAEKLNVSDGYLRYVFKRKYGSTIKEYILKCRIERAMELLKEDDGKIYEVARKCGFTSSQHFCRVFRQITGLSPGEFKGR